MKRLRLLLVLLPLLLVVPGALLVHRALESVAVEQQARHRAVADLLFDEMDRQLAGIVAREEARPYAHYRPQYVQDGMPPGAASLVTSPLATGPAEPFVVGYFQVEPDGSVTGPATWSPEGRADVQRIVATWARETHSPSSDEGEIARKVAFLEAGTTVQLDERKQQAIPAKDDSFDENELYRSFGKNAQRAIPRGGRRGELVPAGNADVFQNVADDDRTLRDEEPRVPLAVGVVTDPLVGRRVDDAHLVLARGVVVGGVPYRQGLVVDVEQLRAHLAGLTLAGNQFASYMRLSWEDDAGPASERGWPHAFQHRFVEPFGSLSATLHLRELPGPGGARYVIGLAVLLALLGALGLLAVHRMAGVTIAYAERRTNFVSAVTHELKTPLTAIRMHGEMLRDGMLPSDEKKRQAYATITAETERLTRLVDNVLELSRLEKGNRPVTLASGDVRPVLAQAMVMLSPQAHEKGFELKVESEDDVPPARFDREALLQVLTSLVDNALKYARGSEDRSIVLGCRRDGDRVSAWVRDHGPGVDAAHQRRIFEPFYRGENELTRTSAGTGIGLALVKGLVERMGGSVSARNHADGGFEVEVHLPPA